MSPSDVLLVSGVAIAGAVTLAWRALYLLRRGAAPPPLDTDAQDAADRRLREQFAQRQRRRSDQQQRAVDEARARNESHGRDLYGL